MNGLQTKIVHIPIMSFKVNNVPTCSAKSGSFDCQFLGHKKFGTEPICNLLNVNLLRGDLGESYLIPDANCPIHGEFK